MNNSNQNKKISIWSFKDWLNVLKNLKELTALAEEAKNRTEEKWYFSEEGKKAYDAANSVAKKTKYFYDYLWAIRPREKLDTFKKRDKNEDNPEAKEFFFKLAFVMANSMDKSSLKFAGHPNILEADKNPIVKLVKNDLFAFKDVPMEISKKNYHDLCSKVLLYSPSRASAKNEDEKAEIFKMELDLAGVFAKWDRYTCKLEFNIENDDRKIKIREIFGEEYLDDEDFDDEDLDDEDLDDEDLEEEEDD